MKEMWDERFASEEYAYGTLPNLFFKEKIEGLHPGKLLLPAEGEGRNAVFAARLGWQVTAVDFSEQGKKKALKLAGIHEVELDYIIHDLTSIDFGIEAYDAAALIYAHIDPGFRKIVHEKIAKSIKPGGYLILEAFNKNQLRNASGGPKSVEMLYSIPMLEDDFKGLDIIMLEEDTIILDQGEFHQGVASVIRLFGRKQIS
jgi:SAM-dependent methyltransferase